MSREPLRTCVGCRTVRPKSELIRLVSKAGRIEVDESGSAAGRGAYVCPGAGCAERARGKLEKALRCGTERDG